jgi:Zn-dependent peptidase ImmA (M78 family)
VISFKKGGEKLNKYSLCIDWCKNKFIKYGFDYQSNSGYFSIFDPINKTVFIYDDKHRKDNKKKKAYASLHELGHLIDYLNEGYTYKYFHINKDKYNKIESEKSAWDIAFLLANKFDLFDDDLIQHAQQCLKTHGVKIE